MKKYILGLIAIMLAFACSKYDDSALREQLKDHEGRIARLETMCKEMQQNITSMSDALNALQSNDYVTNVAPITLDGETIGYTITFAKGKPISIYNGTDGQDGTTPVIGVKQDSDGVWYWTMNGSWLLDAEGKKVRTSGTDGNDGNNGITPQIKIDEGYWYVSVDNGVTWTKLGKATGEDGDSFFKSVEDASTAVIITLADGTVISLPKYQPLNISFSVYESELPVYDQVTIPYVITGSSQTYEIDAISSDLTWHSYVKKTDQTTGNIVIEKGDFASGNAKVMVFVTADNGETTTRVLDFVQGIFTGAESFYGVTSEKQTIGFSVETNTTFNLVIPDEAKNWISLANLGTKATSTFNISLTIEENTGVSRQAEIHFVRQIEKQTSVLYKVTIIQEGPVDDNSIRLNLNLNGILDYFKGDRSLIKIKDGDYANVNGKDKPVHYDGDIPYVETSFSAIGYDVYYPSEAFRTISAAENGDAQIASYFSGEQDKFYCYGHAANALDTPITIDMISLTGFFKLGISSPIDLQIKFINSMPFLGDWIHDIDLSFYTPFKISYSSPSPNGESINELTFNASPDNNDFYFPVAAYSNILNPTICFYTVDGYLVKQVKATLSQTLRDDTMISFGNVTYSDKDAIRVSSVISDEIPTQTKVRVKGKVLRVGKTGFVVNDGHSKENIHIYTSSTPTVSTNDIVQIDGVKKDYGGCIELTSPIIKPLSIDISPVTSSPQELTGEQLTEFQSSSSVLLQMEGTLDVTSEYNTLTIDGADIMININTQEDLSAYHNKRVKVMGYFYGFNTRHTFLNLYLESISLLE